MDKAILTVEEISAILKIKPNTIHSRKWKLKTGCPVVKKGKRLLAENEAFWMWFRSGK